eukprot:gene935-801_t
MYNFSQSFSQLSQSSQVSNGRRSRPPSIGRDSYFQPSSQSSSFRKTQSQFDLQREQLSQLSSSSDISNNENAIVPVPRQKSSRRNRNAPRRQARSNCECDPNFFLANRLCLICSTLALQENQDEQLAKDLLDAVPSTSPAIAYGLLDNRITTGRIDVLKHLLLAQRLNGSTCLRIFADISLLAGQVQTNAAHSRLLSCLIFSLNENLLTKEDFITVMEELLEKMSSGFCNSVILDGKIALDVIIEVMDFRCLLALVKKADTKLIARDLCAVLVEPLANHCSLVNGGRSHVFALLAAVSNDEILLKAFLSNGDLNIMAKYVKHMPECPPNLLVHILNLCPQSVIRVLIEQHYLLEFLACSPDKFADAMVILCRVLGPDDVATIRVVFPTLFASLQNSSSCIGCVEHLAPMIPENFLDVSRLLPPLKGVRCVRAPGRMLMSISVAADKIFPCLSSSDVVAQSWAIFVIQQDQIMDAFMRNTATHTQVDRSCSPPGPPPAPKPSPVFQPAVFGVGNKRPCPSAYDSSPDVYQSLETFSNQGAQEPSAKHKKMIFEVVAQVKDIITKAHDNRACFDTIGVLASIVDCVELRSLGIESLNSLLTKIESIALLLKCLFSHGECGCDFMFMHILQQEQLIYPGICNESDLKIILSGPNHWLDATHMKREHCEIPAWSLWFLFWRHGILPELNIAEVLTTEVGSQRSPVPAAYVIWYSMIMVDQCKKTLRKQGRPIDLDNLTLQKDGYLQKVLLQRIDHVEDLCLTDVLCKESESIAKSCKLEDITLPGIGRRKGPKTLMNDLLDTLLWLKCGDGDGYPVVCEIITSLATNAVEDDRSGGQLMQFGKLLRGSCFIPHLIPSLEYIF